MSDLLRPWLGRTIGQELGEVLQRWSKCEANGSQGTGQVEGLSFEDDGSNLRIRSPRPRVVQIIKFMTHADPLQATLSDSVTRVNATISKEAAQQYVEKHKKRLTAGTLGGLFQLQTFEIVATHLGSRSMRITLFVMDLKPLGSNGSGALGFPRAIEDREELLELIQKLKDYREETVRNGARSRQPTPSKMFTLSSQPDNDSPVHSHRDSQTTFATQVPATRVPSGVNVMPKIASNNVSMNLEIDKDSVAGQPQSKLPGLNELEAGLKGIGKNGTGGTGPFHPSRAGFPPVGGKPQATTSEELLSLLQQAKQVPSTKTAINMAAPAQAQAAPDAESPAPTATNPPMEVPTVAADIHASAADTQIESPSATCINKSAVAGQSNYCAVEGNRSQPSASRPSPRTRNRISRRDIKISKDQELLLDSRDSWLPAQPGQREPSANVPISILQTLNHQADIRAKGHLSLNKKSKKVSTAVLDEDAHGPTFLNDNSPDRSCSESDTPISSSEWPPSPQRNQLPPDSSMESAVVHPSPNSQTRRSSHASTLSQSLRSRQSSPIQKLGSSRHSSDASPNIRTSSLASSPIKGTTQLSKGPNTDGSLSRAPNSKYRNSSPDLPVSASAKSDGVSWGKGNVENGRNDLLGGDALQSDNETSESSEMHNHGPQILASSSAAALNPDFIAPWQLPTSNAATVKHHGELSNLCSIPSSPVSDLEMTIPIPLQSQLATNGFPSTALQPIEPFTQVNRTPYVNGQKVERSLFRSKRLPPTSECGSLNNGTRFLGEDDHVSQSAPSTKETSSADPPNGPAEVLSVTDDCSALANSIIDVLGTAVQPDACEGIYGTQESSKLLERATHPIDKENSRLSSVSQENNSHPRADIETNGPTHDEQGQKRKASDPEILSPNVVRRRKKLKAPAAFDCNNNVGDRPDPAEGAKRVRQDFLAAIKTGVADTPKEVSVTSPTLNYNEASNHAGISDIDNLNCHAGLSRMTDSGRQARVDQQTESSGPDEYQSMQSTDLDLEAPFPQELPQSRSQDALNSHDTTSVKLTPPQNDLPLNTVSDEAESGTQNDDAISVMTQGLTKDITDPNGAGMTENQTSLPLGDSMDDARVESPYPTSQAAQVEATRMFQSLSPYDIVSNTPSQQECELVGFSKSGHEYPTHVISDSVDRPIQCNLLAELPKVESLSSALLGSSTSADIAPRQLSPHLHTKAPSPEIPISILDVESAKVPIPAAQVQSGYTPLPQNIYKKFKAAYPPYPGDQKHFVAVCKKINNLLHRDQMEHQALWDDFIIRHKIEYAEYVRQCTENAEDPMPYEDFYRTEIEQPMYQERVVNRRNLWEALSLADSKVVGVADERKRKKLYTEFKPPRPPSELAEIGPKARKFSSPRITIDLTGDEEPINTRDPKETMSPLPTANHTNQASSRRSGRSLPWAEHGGVVNHSLAAPQGSQHSSLGLPLKIQGVSRGLVANPTKTRDFSNSSPRGASSIPGSDSTSSTKPLTATGDRSNATKNRQREEAESIAWEARIRAAWGCSAANVLGRGYQDSIGNKQKKLLASIAAKVNLEEARDLIMSQISIHHNHRPIGGMPRVTYADLQAVKDRVRARPNFPTTRNGHTRSGQCQPKNDEEKIQLAWGISADNLLEPEYYGPDTKSPKFVKSLAEISDLTIDVLQARKLIKGHMRMNKNRSTSRTMTIADLEAVKAYLLSKPTKDAGPLPQSMRNGNSLTPPLQASIPPNPANARNESRNGEPTGWWNDENTPFKTFATAYRSIRPGNGNSYATHQATAAAGADDLHKRRKDAEMNNAGRTKRIDPLKWKL